MNEAPSIIFGLSGVAAFALIATGIWLLRQPAGNRTKAALMMIAGVVILFNAWLNTIPLPPLPANGGTAAPAASDAAAPAASDAAAPARAVPAANPTA
jgi:hypothetical protein